MSSRHSRSGVLARRAELLAELFLQDLEPQFLSRPTSQDVGYDLLVGFLNKKGGINTFAVEVKATEEPPGSRFPFPRSTFSRFARSNIPGLLLVADVKENRMYFGWLVPMDDTRSTTVAIPLVPVNDATKQELRNQLETVRSPEDSTRINIHESYEVEYWTKKFGVTPDQLRQCVKKVGVMVADVKRCLFEVMK